MNNPVLIHKMQAEFYIAGVYCIYSLSLSNLRLVSNYRYCKSGEVFSPDVVLDMHRAKTFEGSQRNCAQAKTSNHHFHCHCTPLCTEATAFAAGYD